MHALFAPVHERDVNVTEVVLRKLTGQALEPHDRRRA
jgi:hypothetical protein